ncbi:MAG: hypothetical protein FGM24_05290 [Candidatus Kapabacteria bacterium]|nr:hypothetical protein [Candidatus Kapabacteria bacterium]
MVSDIGVPYCFRGKGPEISVMMSSNEALDLLRGLRSNPEHAFRCGYAVLEGEKIIRQAVAAGYAFDALAGTSSDASFVPTCELSEHELADLIGFRPHSPLIGLVRVPDAVDIDAVVFPAVALEGVSDAANVGAIVRTAVGLGIRTIITDSASSHPFLRRAVRTSMGACFRIAHARVDHLASAIGDLTAEGRITIAMEQCPQSIPCAEVIGGVDVLALGNEGAGCSAALLRSVTHVAEIPMAMPDMSLNVAAAAAIGMHALFVR